MIIFIGNIEHDNKIKKNKKIIILGCGKLGKKTYEKLGQIYKEQVCCFWDIDSEKSNNSYAGVPIKQYGIAEPEDYEYIIANLDVRKTYLYLINQGVKGVHISI